MNQLFSGIYDNVGFLVRSNAVGLIIEGVPGWGKSYHTFKALKGLKLEYVVKNGYVSPLRLYETLYKFNGRQLILEDMDDIYHDLRGLSLLKAVLDYRGNGLIGYDSRTPITAPPNFYYNGKIIILTNTVPKNCDSIKSRCLYYKHEIPDGLKPELLGEIAREQGVYTPVLIEQIIKEKGDLRDIIKAKWKQA